MNYREAELMEGKVIKVLIGEVALTRPPNHLQTVLGSCVGIVIYDHSAGLAGMAHVLLPDSRGQQPGKLPGKFADLAVKCLVSSLAELGAKRDRLHAKFAGGARMFAASINYGATDVGDSNVKAVRFALDQHRVRLIDSDAGGSGGRKIEFDLNTLELHIENFAAGKKVI